MTDGNDETTVTMDRRTILRASGVAAGAGAVGLTAGTATASPEQDHYLVASDAHLGSPFANTEDFQQFLAVEVPSVDPDVLVLAGDIYEQWFRGMSSVLLEYSNVTELLQGLNDNGTEVAVVTGNHDRRLITVGINDNDEVSPGAPWQCADEYFFESGGTEFVAVHGDDGDPLQQDPISALLCTGTDQFGAILAELLGWWEGLNPFATVGETGAVTVTATGRDLQRVGLTGAYSDPVVLTSPPVTTNGLVSPRVNIPTPTQSSRQLDRFEVRLDGWAEDTRVDAAAVHYAVLERGRHTLGTDTTVEAGHATADDGWTAVSFAESFDERPVVLTDVQAAGDEQWGARFGGGNTSPAVTDIRNVTPSGFQVRVHEGGRGTPTPQTVGFLAVERGSPTVYGRRLETATSVISETGPLGLDRTFADTPTLLAGPQTAVTDGPTLPAYEQVGADSAHLALRDDTGARLSGTVGYVAFGGHGRLPAVESSAVPTVDAGSRFESQWRGLLSEFDDLPKPEPAPPESPGSFPAIAGMEPMFHGHDGVRDSLLDQYDEFVVFGHTHTPDLGERYANCGSWTTRSPDSPPQNTYVEILDGDVTVWNSTSAGREPLYD